MPAPPWMQKFGGLFSSPQITGGVMGEESAGSPYDPRMAMATELLSSSGYAPYKRSFGELLGPALAAAQQARALGIDRAQQKKLQEAQIASANAATANARREVVSPGATVYEDGQAKYTAPASETGGNSRFRSPQVTESGRLIIQDGATGRSLYTDTGEPWNSAQDRISADMQAITLPDGSVQVVNMRREPGRRGAAPRAEEVVDPETAVSGAAARAGATQGAQETEKRLAVQIDEGYRAADALPTLTRGIELLGEVETGGLDAVRLKASNLFGVTGADEGELSANLGKAVLSQLRSTFGAQFTASEGQRLTEIEAGFGKSTAVNKRLLGQAERLVRRVAERGIRAAQQAGNGYDAEEIRRSMDMTLSLDEPQPIVLSAEDQALVDKYAK